MKSIEIKAVKQIYSQPKIECVELDNDISLQLQSEVPPEGPGETGSLSPEFLQSEPFKNQLG